MLRFVAIAIVAVAAFGCSDSGDGNGGEILLEAGGAEFDGSGFVELVDGADAPLVPGSQSGFHVWTKLRLFGTSGLLFVRREARRVDTGELILRGLPKAVEVADDARDTLWDVPDALPSFLCPSPIGIAVNDVEVALTIELLASDESNAPVLAADYLVVVPRCLPEFTDFCWRICQG